MAKISFDGLEEYIKRLAQLDKGTEGACKAALYEGAAVVHKAIEEEIGTIQEGRGIKKANIEGLKNGLGFSGMENSGGSINIKIGFSGYDSDQTKAYPKGHPIPMMARAIVRGTSFRTKNGFVSRAVKRSKEKAIEAIRRKLDEILEKNMK